MFYHTLCVCIHKFKSNHQLISFLDRQMFLEFIMITSYYLWKKFVGLCFMAYQLEGYLMPDPVHTYKICKRIV